MFAALILFVPFFGIASPFMDTKDSIKLEASLKVLKNINSNDVDSIISFTDGLVASYNRPSQLPLLMKVNQSTGFLLSKYGYLQLAEKYYVDAIAISEKLNDSKEQVDNINSLGVLWGRKGEIILKLNLFFFRLYY
nr:hypothetical protein [uncultured Pedobacter sp.]